MSLSLRYAARSDVGLVREGNEDSGYAGPRLLAVADGMGGHAAGEVASAIALAALAPLDDDDSGGDVLDALSRAVAHAEQTLGRAVDAQPELEGMGTTLTAMLWAGNRIGLAHLGDSRAYLMRDGRIGQLTRDHTYVQSLVDAGRITADEAATHPRRSLITRALDGRSNAEPDLSIREIHAGDRFLLCSDGLSSVVSESTIQTALETGAPNDAVERLVELALRGGGPDNVTAIVADVVELDDLGDDTPRPDVDALVVGAAGDTGDGRGPSLRTPAGRAAAALRPLPPAAVETAPVDRARRRRWIRRSIAAGVLVVIVLGAAIGFRAWTTTQYFVGDRNGQVAIYRGIPQDILGISLSKVYEVQQIEVSSLPPSQQDNLSDTIHATDLAQARRIVAALEASTTDSTPAPTATATPGTNTTKSPTTSTTTGTATSTAGAQP